MTVAASSIQHRCKQSRPSPPAKRRGTHRLHLERLEVRTMLAAGSGLRVDYFHDADLTDHALTRIETTIDANWGMGSPDPAVGADAFSARWSGQIEAAHTGTHEFTTRTDDGVRLWINGRLIVNEWHDQTVTEHTGSVTLVAGRRYDLVMEYYDHNGPAEAHLFWSTASQSQQVVATDQLFPSKRGGLLAERWLGISGTSVTDLTSNADFPNSPTDATFLTAFATPENNGDNFGQRVRGLIHTPQTGDYTFWIAGDETAELWLSNSVNPNSKRLVASVPQATAAGAWSAFPQQRSAPIAMVGGQSYFIEALHKEGTGDDHLSVAWTLPDGAFEGPIAAQFLSPLLPEVRLFHQDPHVDETGSTAATFTIVRQGGSMALPLTVTYTVEGSATSGLDYHPVTGTVTILAGADSAVVSVVPVDDELPEVKESFTVELEDGLDYWLGPIGSRSATGTILDDDDPLPAGGLNAVAADILNAFSVSDPQYGTAQVVVASGPGFNEALEIVTTTQAPSIFSFQIAQPNVAAIATGDVMFVEFYARSTGSGAARLRAIFERGSAPYEKSLDYTANVDAAWTKFQVPFVSKSSYAAGEASFSFQQGFEPQSLQLGGIKLLDFASAAKLLPDAPLADFFTLGEGTYGESRIVQVDAPGFSQALELTTTSRPPFSWQFQTSHSISGAVTQNDLLYVQFYARSVGGSSAQFDVALQRNSPPWTESLSFNASVGSEWTQYRLPFDVVESYGIGEAGLLFRLGFDPQTIQIGGVLLVDVSESASALVPNALQNFAAPDPAFGDSQIVAVSGPGFTEALRVTTTTRPANVRDFEVGQTQVAAIRENDTMYLQFYARSAGPGNASLRVVFQRAVAPHTTSLVEDRTVGSTWELIQLPFDVVEAYAVGDAFFNFQLGFDPQTIELGGVQLINASDALSAETLPRFEQPTTYGGRDGTAAWRAETDARIDQHRRADLNVTVIDSLGQPIEGAAVYVQQTEHVFRFGSAVSARDLTTDGFSDGDTYRDETKRIFNTVTFANDLKWPEWVDDRQLALDAVDWVSANGLGLRGHNLIWPSRTHMPSSVWNTYDDLLADQGATAAANYLQQTILDHIADEASTLAGSVVQWDVVNEPWDNNDAMGVLGDAEMIAWFNAAAAADPGATLYLNDYQLFAANGGNIGHRDDFLDWVSLLQQGGAAIDGIGEQSHYRDGDLTDIDRLAAVMQPFVDLGLPIEITEFDVNSLDEQLQADYLRDYATFMFGHTSVEGFVHWGFWAGDHYLPQAALYRSDWSIKPNGQAWEDLVYGDWWTDERGTTAGDGQFNTRAFQGDYEIMIEHGGVAQTVMATVGQDGLDLTVTLASGDFTGDGVFDTTDIDLLVSGIASGLHNLAFDLTGDGLVDLADRDAWLAEAALINGLGSPYKLGDANLDGAVDGLDFIAWNANKFTSTAAWSAGDFSADGFVDGLDFVLWNANKFTSSDKPLGEREFWYRLGLFGLR